MTLALAVPDHGLALCARPLDVLAEFHELVEQVLPGTPIESDARWALHMRLTTTKEKAA